MKDAEELAPKKRDPNDPRTKLIDGVQQIHKQNSQLDNAERLGHETNFLLKDANRELRNQREVLIKVSDKNQEMRVDLERGGKLVQQMHFREFAFRIMMYLLIVALAFTDVLVLFLKLFN